MVHKHNGKGLSIGLTNPKISIKLYSKSKRFDDEED